MAAELQTDQYELPLMFRVGVSMDVLKGFGNSNLILSADALHPNDDVEYLNVGGEYVFYDILSLRGGYKGLFAKNSEQGISLGGGVHYTVLESATFYFDYSYIDYGRFSAVHTFSISLGFLSIIQADENIVVRRCLQTIFLIRLFNFSNKVFKVTLYVYYLLDLRDEVNVYYDTGLNI